MTKLILNCKPATLKAGDHITYRKGDGVLTIMRGPELMHFRHTNSENDAGDRKIAFGKVECPNTFFEALRILVSTLTGFDTRTIKTGNAYMRFDLIKPAGGDV